MDEASEAEQLVRALYDNRWHETWWGQLALSICGGAVGAVMAIIILR